MDVRTRGILIGAAVGLFIALTAGINIWIKTGKFPVGLVFIILTVTVITVISTINAK